MLKLTVTESSSEQVEGNVIDLTQDSSYALRHYGKNEYGVYDVETIAELTEEEICNVTERKSLAARVRRIHYFFPTAKYITQAMISCLNYNNEDPFKVLKNVVNL